MGFVILLLLGQAFLFLICKVSPSLSILFVFWSDLSDQRECTAIVHVTLHKGPRHFVLSWDNSRSFCMVIYMSTEISSKACDFFNFFLNTRFQQNKQMFYNCVFIILILLFVFFICVFILKLKFHSSLNRFTLMNIFCLLLSKVWKQIRMMTDYRT